MLTHSEEILTDSGSTISTLNVMNNAFASSIKAGDWLVINPTSSTCTIRKVTGKFGTIISFAPNIPQAPEPGTFIELQTAPKWDIRLFGAAPNKDALTNTKAIQAAINDCNINGGGTVYFPEGVFEIGKIEKEKASVVINSNHSIKFIGAGKDRTELQLKEKTEQGAISLFYVNGTDCNLEWHQMTLATLTTNSYSIYCDFEGAIEEQNNRNILIDDVKFINANHQSFYTNQAMRQLVITNCSMNSIDNNRI